MSIDPHALYQQMRDCGRFSPTDISELAQSLWDYYGEELFLFARTKLKNIEDARDVCQDTILSAIGWLHRDKGRYAGAINYPAWLTRIARHKITDRLRRSGRETPWSSLAPSHDDAKAESSQDSITSDDLGPVERLGREEEIARLRECVKALRPTWLRALRLYYCKCLTYKEIAVAIGRPISTVGVMLHRAVGQLRECVGIEWTFQPRKGA